MTLTEESDFKRAETDVMALISSGYFDTVLDSIVDAAKKRQHSLRVNRSATDFGVGDAVKFNDLAATKYLHGHHAVVTEIRNKKLKVRLKRPAGKHAEFVNGEWQGSEVIVPPSIIDLIVK